MSLTSVPANAAGFVGSSCLIIWLSLQKIMPREKQTDILFFLTMGKGFQCVFSTCNKTKPIENKIPRDWEITKLTSLWQFFIARLLANLWMCVLLYLSALQVNSAWFLYLYRLKGHSSWETVDGRCMFLCLWYKRAQSTESVPAITICLVAGPFFSDHLSPKT